MKVLYDTDAEGRNPSMILIAMDAKEASTMIAVLAAAITGKRLSKASKAYKLAQSIEDDMPNV